MQPLFHFDTSALKFNKRKVKLSNSIHSYPHFGHAHFHHPIYLFLTHKIQQNIQHKNVYSFFSFFSSPFSSHFSRVERSSLVLENCLWICTFIGEFVNSQIDPSLSLIILEKLHIFKFEVFFKLNVLEIWL